MRDTWYVPGNQQANGDWKISEEYLTNRPNKVVFIEGQEIDTQSDEEHTISFKGPWTYSNKINDSTTYTNYLYDTDGIVEYTYEDSVYYSSKLEVEYSHDLVVIEVPSNPNISYPTDQGYTYPSVTYNWDASDGNGTITYHIQVSTDSTFNTIFYENSSISSTSVNVTQHGYGTEYYWKVRASNEAGTSDWSTIRSFTTRPDSPSVTGSVENGHPKLSWSNTDGAISYEIYKRVDTTNWLLYATTSSTSYIDTLTDVTGYQGIVNYNTPYVAYYVRAIGVNDAWNNEPTEHYYDPDGVSPHSIGGIEF